MFTKKEALGCFKLGVIIGLLLGLLLGIISVLFAQNLEEIPSKQSVSIYLPGQYILVPKGFVVVGQSYKADFLGGETPSIQNTNPYVVDSIQFIFAESIIVVFYNNDENEITSSIIKRIFGEDYIQ